MLQGQYSAPAVERAGQLGELVDIWGIHRHVRATILRGLCAGCVRGCSNQDLSQVAVLHLPALRLRSFCWQCGHKPVEVAEHGADLEVLLQHDLGATPDKGDALFQGRVLATVLVMPIGSGGKLRGAHPV
jgi:hypothetical protein